MAAATRPLPTICFAGTIYYARTEIQVNDGLDYLLSQDSVCRFGIGIDMEWQPDFMRGDDHPIAVIQLATFHFVLVIHILHIHPFPRRLKEMLEDVRIAKIGQAIRGTDSDKLWRHYGVRVAGCTDLQTLAFDHGFRHVGLKNLTRQVFGFHLDKRLATTNWARHKLTSSRLIYAATDAWITLHLYHRLYNIKH